MGNVRIVGNELIIDGDPAEMDIPTLAATIAIGEAIEAWEVQHGGEMSPNMMEFAGRFFFSGFNLGRRATEVVL